jgi:TonB family protein
MICGNCGNQVDSIHRFCPKCGAEVQYQAPPPVGGSPYTPPSYAPPQYGAPLPPKKGSSCGKIIIIAVIILVLLGIGIAGAIYYGYRYAENKLKSSEAYTVAIKTLKENDEVREKLGDIQDTGFPIGAYNDNGSTGTAVFVIGVHGTKARGQYQVELRKSENVWTVIKGSVKTADGDTILIVRPRVSIDEPTNVPSPPGPPFSSDPRAKGAISGGVLNAKATTLPQPLYPAIAKTAKASGTVVVRVLVDENGDVINAQAVSGHPLLQAVSVAAARQAKFTPTKVSGKPVRVIGFITYTFKP